MSVSQPRWILSVAVLLALVSSARAQQRREDWNFLISESVFEKPHEMLSAYLQTRAEKLLEQRRHAIQQIKTRDDLKKRQEYWRERMWADLGGQPERTPLNARTVGVLDRGEYRIEKVIFESRPHFYVTANLYLPSGGKGPFPAILYPLGHESGAKTHSAWQYTLANLARRGFVCLAWDPVGQGERIQFFDEDWHDSKLQASTSEHNVLGMQSLLLGSHIAQFTVWDGIRALDYLLSRPEVDPKRVGATGNSGGGTHTAYLSGLDDRIQVAAPSCYITSWHRMIRTIGPQDAEQVFPFWLKDGLDYPDFIYAFAGRPFLIMSAIRDFFPIGGARATYEEVRQTLTRLDLSDRIAMFEADDGHGYTKPRRERAYKWFSRWLQGTEGTTAEFPIHLASEEELKCTKTGQVKTAFPDAVDVYTINRARGEQLRASRHPSPEEVRQSAAELIHFEKQTGPVHVDSFGSIIAPRLITEKLVYESEPGISIPAVLLVPVGGGARKPAVLLADSRGKAAVASEAEALATQGNVVLVPDLRGFGETTALPAETGNYARLFGDYRSAMMAMLVGGTMPGMRALDLVRGFDLLAHRNDVDTAQMRLIGRGGAAVPALYASLLDGRISGIVLEGMLASYHSVVSERLAMRVTEQVIPSALKHFDLPDVVAAIAPRRVILSNASNPLGQTLTRSQAAHEYTTALSAYKSAGAADSLRITTRNEEEECLPEALKTWFGH